MVVREAVTCAAHIEFQYYNSPVYYHCGLGEDNLIDDDDEIKELRTMYATVLPNCKSEGKPPFSKIPSNVAKRR